jgi:hypothetical protein
MMHKKYDIDNETVGIKSHNEHEFPSAECSDMKYLHGEDPAEYSLRQENALAMNTRKHAAH